MFMFNTDTPKKFKESIKYLDRKAIAKLSIKDRKAYLLNDVAFIISTSDIYEFQMKADSLSNMIKSLYELLINLINMEIKYGR